MKLELYYPVRPYHKNQDFGDSMACTEDNNLPIAQRRVVTKKESPSGKFVCPIGYVELYPLLGMKGHTGQDMMASTGQNVYYAGPDGVVEEISLEVERGLGVGVVTNDQFHFTKDAYVANEGDYYAKTRYWHLKTIGVVQGQKIKTGDLIGTADSTGLSSGPHLHFELKPVLKNSQGNYYNVFQGNGYFGSIEPAPFFNGKYADELRQYHFDKDITYMSSGEDVKRLQSFLNKMGYFNYEITGYFGDITREALYAFQVDYVLIPIWKYPFDYFITKGRVCGPKTRAVINNLS